VVIQEAQAISPADLEAWEMRVVQPTLALAEGAVGALWRGWARGLALVYFASWTISLLAFTTVLIMRGRWLSVELFSLAGTGYFLYLPMAMSRGVAEVHKTPNYPGLPTANMFVPVYRLTTHGVPLRH
jgi:hypothetical protein